MSLEQIEARVVELRQARTRAIEPCPVLPGQRPVLCDHVSATRGKVFYVQCDNPADAGDWSVIGPFRKTAEEAIVAWNEGMRRDR